MKVSLLCSDAQHPVNAYLVAWMQANQAQHHITLARRKAELPGGDILFLVSCGEIVNAQDRSAYSATVVLHASAPPRGRGWSPHIWDVVHGAEEVTVSLLEAEDKIDSGRIWKQMRFPVPKHALWDEINARLFEVEIALIDFAVTHFAAIEPQAQSSDTEASYYRKRTPQDSQIDAERSIASQFDLIRVCDPHRFPAFFELHGCRYKLIVEKMDASSHQD